MDNLDLMRLRLNYQGGIHQEDRMIKDKYKTFLKTLLYSYQAATVARVQEVAQAPLYAEYNATPVSPIAADAVRALINPDKVKQNYDDKILSIDKVYNWQAGDVFEWCGTDTRWLITLEQKTEDAYMRSSIRRCKYMIKFKDSEGKIRYTWAAIRGPIETQINSIQKNQIRVDQPNLSLNLLMPKNPYTLEAFKRYNTFFLADQNERCYRVEAIDNISMDGVLEVAAEEYYYNKEEDDLENQISKGLVVEPVDPTPQTPIQGEWSIKPMISQLYTIDTTGGTWSVSKDVPVLLAQSTDGTKCEVRWTKAISGQFTLSWEKDNISYDRIIVVESLF